MAASQDNHGIEAYFTPVEFERFSEYEKLRFSNMKQNYEMMIKVGLNVPPPDFMRQPNRNNTKVSSCDIDGADEKGTKKQLGRRKSHKKASSFKVPVKRPGRQERQAVNKKVPATISQPPMYDSDDAFEQLADITIGATDDDDDVNITHDGGENLQNSKDTNTGTKRYSLREGTRKSYKDLEAEDDDVYVYCEDCNELYQDDCPSHPLTIIEDTPVPPKCKSRAKLSLPPGLAVKEAGIEGAGKGIWAQKFFPKGVRFGPYGGEIVANEKMGRESGYSWEIFHDKKRIHYINGKNKSKANWMRYVNCARNEVEQNLIAYQYRGQIYYRSFKPIDPGKELLVYYGEEYAKELGIEEEKFTNDGSSHPCELCPGVAFTSRLFYLKHLKYRHHQFVDLTLYQSRSSPHIGKSLCKIVSSSSRQDSQDNCRKVQTARTVRFHGLTSIGRYRKEVTCANVRTSLQGVASKYVVSNEDTVTKRYGDEGKYGTSRQKHARHCVGKCHTCRVCGKESKSNATLIIHMRIHTGERPYRCKICGRAFNDKGSLGRHIRGIHEGIKPHKCQYCQKTFGLKHELEDHIRIHTGEKPYKCRTCGKGFNVKSNLVNHERIHSGIKPYQCTQCNKTFTERKHLTDHLRIHTGEKPYKCHVCGKRCTQRSNLTTHMRTHTGEKPYKCLTCGKKFADNSSWNVHKRKCNPGTT